MQPVFYKITHRRYIDDTDAPTETYLCVHNTNTESRPWYCIQIVRFKTCSLPTITITHDGKFDIADYCPNDGKSEQIIKEEYMKAIDEVSRRINNYLSYQ